MKKLAIVLSCLVLVVGFVSIIRINRNRPIVIEDLYGCYAGSYEGYSAELHLQQDGNYQFVYEKDGKEAQRSSGAWRYYTWETEGWIGMEGISIIVYGKSETMNYNTPLYRNMWGQIVIDLYWDADYHVTKTKCPNFYK